MIFKPEDIDQIRARYPLAVSTVYSLERLAKGVQSPPESNRDNVLDFVDGLRLIVSTIDVGGGKQILNVNASYQRIIAPEVLTMLAKGAMEQLDPRAQGGWDVEKDGDDEKGWTVNMVLAEPMEVMQSYH